MSLLRGVQLRVRTAACQHHCMRRNLDGGIERPPPPPDRAARRRGVPPSNDASASRLIIISKLCALSRHLEGEAEKRPPRHLEALRAVNERNGGNSWGFGGALNSKLTETKHRG